MYAYLVWTMYQVLVAVGLVVLLAAAAAAYLAKRSAARPGKTVVQLPVRTPTVAKRAA